MLRVKSVLMTNTQFRKSVHRSKESPPVGAGGLRMRVNAGCVRSSTVLATALRIAPQAPILAREAV